MSNEELKLKLSVIISATNTSGNQKLDAIMELFNQLHPSPTPDVTPVEDGKQGGEVKTDKIKLKLEYKVIHIDGSDEYGKRQSYSKEAELLNDMGNEGWELVSVTASSINYNVYYYFKQSKT